MFLKDIWQNTIDISWNLELELVQFTESCNRSTSRGSSPPTASRCWALWPAHIGNPRVWRPGGMSEIQKKKKKPCIHSDIKCRFRGVHFTSYQLNTRLLRPEDLPLYAGGPKAQAWENFFFQIGSHDLRSQNGNDATKSTKCWFLWSWGNNIWGKKPSSCFFRTNHIFGKHKHEDFFCEKMLISNDILNVWSSTIHV